MATQIITIAPDGSVSGLDHKKKGVDLRKLGKAKIRRATLIEWDERKQAWFIRWEGREDNREWTLPLFLNCHLLCSSFNGQAYHSSGVVYFEEYEDAVKAEVAVIQSLQKSGKVRI